MARKKSVKVRRHKRELTVHRVKYTKKKYYRKGYTRKDGTKVSGAWVQKTKVPATTFKIKDVGAPGRGKKKIVIKRKGALGVVGYSTSKSTSERRRALRRAVKKYGKDSVWRMLNAQVRLREKAGEPGEVFRPNVASKARIFQSDRDWITRTHGGPTPRAAIRAWKRMSPRERARRMPGG